jgi:hypothetical protein
VPEPRVRIVSDNGFSTGTRVLVDGRELPGVLRVSWSVGVDEVARAVVELDAVGIDVAAPAADLVVHCAS